MAPSHQGSLDHSSFLSTNGTGDGLGHQLSGGAHIHSALRHITICRHPFVTLLIHTHTRKQHQKHTLQLFHVVSLNRFTVTSFSRLTFQRHYLAKSSPLRGVPLLRQGLAVLLLLTILTLLNVVDVCGCGQGFLVLTAGLGGPLGLLLSTRLVPYVGSVAAASRRQCTTYIFIYLIYNIYTYFILLHASLGRGTVGFELVWCGMDFHDYCV